MRREGCILEEIVDKLSLYERFFIKQYLNQEKMDPEEFIRVRALEDAMNKEPERWWKSEYPQERAYGQFFCDTVILNFDIYKQDMQKLLRREVTFQELLQKNKLAKEVNEKYQEWKKG